MVTCLKKSTTWMMLKLRIHLRNKRWPLWSARFQTNCPEKTKKEQGRSKRNTVTWDWTTQAKRSRDSLKLALVKNTENCRLVISRRFCREQGHLNTQVRLNLPGTKIWICRWQLRPTIKESTCRSAAPDPHSLIATFQPNKCRLTH